MNDEIVKATGVLIGGVLATVTPYIVTWVKHKFKKDETATSFIHNTSYRAQINEVLVEIRTLARANRVSIVEYHNGNIAINGLPFNYASITYEKTDQTTKEVMMNFQKVPISPTCEALLDVHNSSDGYIRIAEDYKYEDVVDFYRYYGVKSGYVFRIGDHIKLGTVQLAWINEEVTLDEDLLDELHFKVKYIYELMKKMKKH